MEQSEAEKPGTIHLKEKLSGQSKGRTQRHEAEGAGTQHVPALLLAVATETRARPARAGGTGECRDGNGCQLCGAVAMIRKLDFILG